MIEFEAKCFNTISIVKLERLSDVHIQYIFQYLSVTSFRVSVDDGQHAEIPKGERAPIVRQHILVLGETPFHICRHSGSILEVYQITSS
jgi:hypothetical protein